MRPAEPFGRATRASATAGMASVTPALASSYGVPSRCQVVMCVQRQWKNLQSGCGSCCLAPLCGSSACVPAAVLSAGCGWY